MGIDLLHIRFQIERSFGVELGSDDFLDDSGRVRMQTVGELHSRIVARLASPASDNRQPPSGDFPVDCWNEDDVWSELVRIIADALALEPDCVTRDARLTEDLGAE